MVRTPYITPELLEYLERLYPDRSPRIDTPDRQVWFQSGQADLVRHLRSVFDQQNENITEGS